MKKTKYIVKTTSQFKRDYKLAMKRHLKISLLEEVVAHLALGEPLPDKNHDHALTGDWVGRSAVVNLSQISRVSKTEIKLSDGTSVFLPRGAYESVNRAIIGRGIEK